MVLTCTLLQLRCRKQKAEQTYAREVRKLESLQKAKSLLESEPQIRAEIDRMNAEAAREVSLHVLSYALTSFCAYFGLQ